MRGRNSRITVTGFRAKELVGDSEMTRGSTIQSALIGIGGIAIGFIVGKGTERDSPEQGVIPTMAVSGEAIDSRRSGFVDLEAGLEGLDRNLVDSAGKVDRNLRLGAFTAELEREDFAPAIALAMENSSAFRRREMVSAIFERWMEENPEEAIDHVFTLPDRYREDLFSDLLPIWIVRNFHEAMGWLEGKSAEEIGHGAVTAALGAIAARDPARALALQSENSLFSGDRFRQSKAFIVSRWATKDVEGAAAYSLTIEDGNDRRNAIANVAMEWAQIDFETGWKWTEQISGIEDRSRAQQRMLDVLVETDHEAALRRFDDINDPAVRQNLSANFLNRLARENSSLAYEYASENFAEPLKSQLLSSLIQTWATHQPETAFLVAAKEMPFGNDRVKTLSLAIEHISRRDFDQAVGLLREIEPEGTRNKVTSTMAHQLVRTDLEKTRQFAEGLPEGGVKEHFYMRIAEQMAETDPRAASEFIIAKMDPERYLQRSLGSVLRKWSRQAPVDALTWTIENTDEPTMEYVAPDLVGDWATGDIQAADRWAKSLPEGSLRTRVFQSILGSIAQKDIAEAAEWVDALPKTPERDAVVSTFVDIAKRIDPVSAITWAKEISDDRNRRFAIRQVAEGWYRDDATAAEKWMHTSGFFTDEEISEIIKRAR